MWGFMGSIQSKVCMLVDDCWNLDENGLVLWKLWGLEWRWPFQSKKWPLFKSSTRVNQTEFGCPAALQNPAKTVFLDKFIFQLENDRKVDFCPQPPWDLQRKENFLKWLMKCISYWISKLRFFQNKMTCKRRWCANCVQYHNDWVHVACELRAKQYQVQKTCVRVR